MIIACICGGILEIPIIVALFSAICCACKGKKKAKDCDCECHEENAGE